MSDPADKHHINKIERQLIQALCQETPDDALRETAKHLLSDYDWREPIHQAIFDSLKDIPSKSPVTIRDRLPARVTRKGFPEVNWKEFFAPSTLSIANAEDLMRQLRDARGDDM